MRYVLGICFVLFLFGFVACTFLLGGPPSSIYGLKDVILGGALLLATLSAIVLGLLVLGVAAKGRKRSYWRVPLLCIIALLVNFVLAALILMHEPMNLTEEHVALTLRMRICAVVMIALGLFSLCSLIATLFLAKRHNSKLTIAAA